MAGLDCGYIVVGFDGTPASVAALRWALRRAAEMRTAVRIVHCWPPARVTGRGRPHRRIAAVRSVEDEVDAARATLSDAPEVSVLFTTAPVQSALAGHCRRAGMLVLGASAPEVLVDPASGPVAGPCLRRVGCPVVLVDRSGRAATADPRHPALGTAV